MQTIQRIGIVGNPDRDPQGAALNELVRLLREEMPGVGLMLSDEMSAIDHAEISTGRLDDVAQQCDVLFSIGGDGTMLRAARAILHSNPKARLAGVNVGKLGFLSENPPQELPELVRELARNELKVESRLMLEAVVSGESPRTIIKRSGVDPSSEGHESTEARLLALNEFVIDNYGSTRMLTFEIHVDGALMGSMRADGLIIATPTGSTGYAVSAGGPIVEPTSPVLLITAIAPHSLNIRPVVLPERCTFTVRAMSDETKQSLVVADGQEEVIADNPAIVRVRAASERLQLLRRKQRSYFDLLRQKLLWSIDQRESGRS